MTVQLYDLELERAVLGTCLMRPETMLGLELEDSDFWSDAHRTIWRALLWVHADGEIVDTWRLRGRLLDEGKLQAVGGDEYLLGLTDTIEGQIVGYIDSGADDSRVAIRIDTAENPPRHIIYRASFATSLAIPSLSHVGQIGLALILVLAALWALSRRSGVGDEG